ncbi:MAG: hypothetical protein QOJ74_405, partial [Ilumatobacteraceae bacterium]|nr:hypothetical protein [Ilumatobacteraceae bacterium]
GETSSYAQVPTDVKSAQHGFTNC